MDRYFASIDYNVSVEKRVADNGSVYTWRADNGSYDKLVADRKKLSDTNYNKFAILRVSSNLDLSKHSFLLYLTEIGLPHDIQEQRDRMCWQGRICYEQLFLDNTFDSELCSMLREKKSNLVHHCRLPVNFTIKS